MLEHAVSCTGFTPKALEALLSELLCTAEELFERPLKQKDIRKLREDIKSTFQNQMMSALFEVQMEMLQVQTEMLKELKRMAEKQAVQIIPIQEQVLASDVLPRSAAASTSKARAICNSEEEETKVESVKQFEDQEKEDNKKNNPNRLMSFKSEDSGKGQLGLSKCNDGKIEVIFEGLFAKRAMRGMEPMKVSEKLNYFYFEVGVVEMVELSGRSKTCPKAGVGVGLARCKKFKNDKMVGCYSNSFGYDGRTGNVQCEGYMQEPFGIGILAKGDTLGIGLLQLPRQHPAIFFVKNNIFQGYTQKHQFSSTDLLYPVVSVVSRRSKLCVNFHGPFHLPSGLDLAVALYINL